MEIIVSNILQARAVFSLLGFVCRLKLKRAWGAFSLRSSRDTEKFRDEDIRVQKTGSNRKNIGERSEPSGILGRGKGRRILETCHWFRRSMIPDSGIMLWLVKCLHVDRFAVLLTVSRSFNITLLQIGKRFFKNTDFEQQYKFLCETFLLSFGSKNSKKYACDQLQKEKESFKIWSYKLRHIYKATD